MKLLTAAQLETLNEHLEARRRELAVQIREALAASEHQHYRDLAGTVTDSADEALADALVDVETALIDRDVQALRDIEAARERLKLGAYGICIDCGDAVDYARLLAYPTAKRCVRCQRQRETLYAHQKTPSL